MKKVQDYYFKKAKKEKYPARSVYKLEEVQSKYRFLRPGDKVLDLGCHPGSWAMYAAKVVGPQGLVVGVDLQSSSKINIRGAAKVHLLCADIVDSEMTARLKEFSPEFNAVISDIAPRTTGNKWADQQKSLTLARRSFELALELLQTGGSFYCKVFEGEDFQEFVKEVRQRFGSAKVVKPKSSRSESREVFVLGKGFKGVK